MKSRSSIIAAVVFLCGLAGGLVYANVDTLEATLAGANEHTHGTQRAAPPRYTDPLGCHRHAPANYHCH